MKLSIVLTVYNKEPYLCRALDALLGQEDVMECEYEILAVNDGSTDGSATILEQYASKDSRLHILTQENQGLSMARNNGAAASNGDYVWFVDADDTISPKSVRMICDVMSECPDVIPIYAKTNGIDKIRNEIPVNVTTGKEVILCSHWQACSVFWVFRLKFLKNNNLWFMSGIYHEDAEFTPRMLYAAKSVKVVPEALYTVYRISDSITQVPRAKRAFDYLKIATNLSAFVVGNGEQDTAIGKAIDDFTAMAINNAFSIIVVNNKEMHRQLNSDFFEKRHSLIRVLKSSQPIKYRIEALLFQLFPKHYVQVYRTMKLFG